METPTPRQIRRPSAVIRDLLLNSARQLFAAKGYAGASTRQIAEEAGVREALIFRHFGNKAGLFRAAVIDPFRAIIEGFVDDWEAGHESNTMSTHEITGAWITSLHALMRQHRELVIALITANDFDEETEPGTLPITDAFAGPIRRLEKFTRREMAGRGLATDPVIGVRATFGMVLAMAVLDDWFFAGVARRPGTEAVTREMTDMIVFGIAGKTVAHSGGRG
ncbi:MAG TPA: helix-turn-helix domain-containing protein [Sporichthyaceae bacterium]|nr:helix-turn-helix domain-containing protein [Sporichthyaceae bacterium]